MAHERASGKRPNACYRVFETRVELHGHGFRALVVNSSAHDKRRHKRIDRQIDQDRQELEKRCKLACAGDFFCRADSQALADKLRQHSGLHTIQAQIVDTPVYTRGWPAASKVREPKTLHYQIACQIVANPDKLDPLRQEAGCFVLISSLDNQADREQWDDRQLLSLYKEQNGIEKNFSFLKDPLIINSIFLKKPERSVLVVHMDRFHLARKAIASRVKSGRSAGVRELMRFLSTTTSWSTHLAPALTRSSRME